MTRPTGGAQSWGAGDVIVFSPGPFSPLFRVPAAGGSPTAVTEVPQKSGSTHRLPYFLPDGKHLLFFRGRIKTIDKENTIAVLDLESRKVTTIAHENSEGRYADPGFLLFYREGNLMAQPFDARALKLTGEAVPIAEKVQFSPFRYSASFGMSRSGLFVLDDAQGLDVQAAAPGPAGHREHVTRVVIRGQFRLRHLGR